jgi:hypothetical protein
MKAAFDEVIATAVIGAFLDAIGGQALAALTLSLRKVYRLVRACGMGACARGQVRAALRTR